MPNQNYCGPSEDIVMADCNLSVPFAAGKNEEKLCKYSYASWCPTCEPPRRRTRSETNEPYKRKSKEMKTLTPKKYNRCQEYENMELEYDSKDLRYDCNRVRSNLVELPTTYISNNCQHFTGNVSNLTKVSTSNSDYLLEKLPKNFEHFYKLIDYNTNQNFISMSEKHAKLAKAEDCLRNSIDSQKYNFNKIDIKYNLNVVKVPNGGVETRKTPPKHLYEIPKQVLPKMSSSSLNESPLKIEKFSLTTKLLPSETQADFRPTKSKQPSCKQNCNVYDLKYREPPDVYNPKLSYDTCTIFDKREFDFSDLSERYVKEIEVIRGRLKQIRRARAQEHARKEIIQINSSDEQGKVEIVDDVAGYKRANASILPKLEATKRNDVNALVGRPLSERKEKIEKVKVEKPQRISLKARSKRSTIKSRQIRSKISVLDVAEKEYSESELSDAEEEAAVNVEDSEESAKTSETSVKANEKVAAQIGAGDGVESWPLRESLFPNIPPYISFNWHDADSPFNLPSSRRYLKWKLSTITPIVVRKTLTNTGFRLVRKSNEWLGTWGKHMKSPLFKTLKDTQKLNHFPGTFQIGRKDRLWKNLQRLMLKFGMKEFGFIPQTYILPQDFKLLKQNWEFKNGSGGEVFIIKPPASARGVGIKVINKWSQLPKKSSLVVQKYIGNPYLINGSKFDLRLYVLVTSFNPLRIYLYPDGLARFASVKYSDDVKDLKDRYMHLTNYSINKLSSQYTANEDANACQGHKWTLSKLWEYLEKEGIDTKSLWKTLENLVIKTIISGESPITQLSKEYLNNRYNCYELFGVDVLLDERLKPWLLEVNISPSLHSASPLDAYVKGPLVKALFDMAQFHLPLKLAKTEGIPPYYEPKLYTTALLKKERNKHNYFSALDTREEYLEEILDNLTGDDVRHLTQAEDELTVTGPFARIFPTSQTHKYLQFMEVRYYNRLFDAWECKYEKNRQPGIRILQSLCEQKLHLKVGSHPTIDKSLESMIPAEMNVELSTEKDCNSVDHRQTSSVNP